MSCDPQAVTLQLSTEFFWENRTTEEVYKQVLTSVKHQSVAKSQLGNSNPSVFLQTSQKKHGPAKSQRSS